MLKAGGVSEPDLTPEEFDRFEKAFKDPQFKKLFKEYVDEISNPETRQLYESEISAIENERGFDIRFIKPEPGCCIKTRYLQKPPTIAQQSKAATGSLPAASRDQSASSQDATDIPSETKVFINLCTSPEIEEAAASDSSSKENGKKATISNNSAAGQHWSIPYSLTPPRRDTDRAGKMAVVYDCIFHPNTFLKGKQNPRFEQLLVDSALEGIETKFTVKLSRDIKWPNLPFKGVAAAAVIRTPKKNTKQSTEPVNQFIPNKLAPEKKENVPRSSSSSAAHPPKQQQQPQKSPSAQQSMDTKVNQPTGTVSSSPNHSSAPKNITASNSTSTTSKGDSDGKETPAVYHATYRSKFKMQDYAINSFGKYEDGTAPCHPDEIIIRFDLPRVTKADDIVLDTSDRLVKLRVPNIYNTEVPLSYSVDDGKGKAKFDKSKRQLTVTLPVKPASLPPPMPPTVAVGSNEAAPSQHDNHHASGIDPLAAVVSVSPVPEHSRVEQDKQIEQTTESPTFTSTNLTEATASSNAEPSAATVQKVTLAPSAAIRTDDDIDKKNLESDALEATQSTPTSSGAVVSEGSDSQSSPCSSAFSSVGAEKEMSQQQQAEESKASSESSPTLSVGGNGKKIAIEQQSLPSSAPSSSSPLAPQPFRFATTIMYDLDD